MNKNSNKLISLLQTLDRSQQRSALQFLQSPYFNRSQDLTTLFGELTERLEKDKSLQKELLWKTIWGKKPFNDTRFRKFCSDLYKLLEHFLSIEELQHQPFLKTSLYLKAMNRQRPARTIDGIDRNWDSHLAPNDHQRV
ncbi:MAG: hypothetical protein HC821_03820 [Lewinella sp.]|nr:hypothetical protein [Lewinella sp.]